MGEPYQRQGSSSWYIKVKGVDGVWRPFATTCKTEKQARSLALRLNAANEERRLGIRPKVEAEDPNESPLTLGWSCSWWLDECCSEDSRGKEESRLRKHVISQPIGELRLPEVTTDGLEDHWKVLERGGLSGSTLNRLRASLHSVFERLRKRKKWIGLNPVSDVERREVFKKDIDTLRAEEVPLFLAQVSEDWRGFCATALWLALRKGEICGLKKTDVDLEGRIIKVLRSYDKLKPKGGHAAALPIPAPLIPFLEDALVGSKSEWLFPDEMGEMRTEESDPQKIVRTALKRAGMVRGWEHVCRRCKAKGRAGHTHRYADAVLRKCPECQMRMWPKAIARDLNFHSLRHTVATLLLRAKIPAHHVQKILRHASITTTTGMYGHLDVEDLRDAVQALPSLPSDFGAMLVQSDKSDPGPRVRGAKIAMKNAVLDGAGKEIRTLDPRLGNPPKSVTRGYGGVTGTRNHSSSSGGAVQEFHPVAPNSTEFGALVVQSPAPLRALRGLRPGLLSVRDVAAALGVSGATVYGLCERGELLSFRVSNSIRVDPSELAAFIERQKGPTK